MSHVRVMRVSGWLAFAAAAGLCVSLWVWWPHLVSHKGRGTAMESDVGWFEAIQSPWYFAAMGLMLVAWRQAAADRGFYAAAALGFFVLGWRELDPDKMLTGERWYNAPAHLFDSSMPPAHRLLLAALFAGFLALIVAAVLRHRHDVWRWHQRAPWRWSHSLLAVGFAMLAYSFMLDKLDTFERNLGFDLTLTLKAFQEEAAELLGAAMLLLGAIELYAIAVRPDVPDPDLSPRSR